MSSASETVATLMRAADLARRQMNAVVEPHGLTLQQFNVLRILRGAGPTGMPTLEVANRMVEETPGITRLLDRLEQKQLIRRQRCPKDRRQHLCWLTAAGLALLQKTDAPIARTHENTLKGLRRKDRVAFNRLLGAMRAAHG
ncbi:MAG TPA: MarR family transcriptional regulator [Vicinamibacterales bacterium]|nr:MarR family transcriptional regulator [Vicinamibacterales bacterium]